MSVPCPRCGNPLPVDGSGCPCTREETVALADSRTMTQASGRTTPLTENGFDVFRTGEMLAGRYRIVSLLGRGGMGQVYLAEDLRIGEKVALKFLPASWRGDSDLLARFHSELRTARKVTHPNVCRVYDIAEARGAVFLSMEFVDGEDLGSLLRRIGRLPEDKTLELAVQLCSGLGAAHELGIVHRDLKPANIMIDGKGKAKIMDFGLALLTEEMPQGEIAGTPLYMAPEQLEKGEASIAADLYALGLILYEMFTGKRPYDNCSDTRSLLVAKQKGLSDHSLSALRHLDPDSEHILRRCLDPDPADRPQSAREIAVALPGNNVLDMAMRAGEAPSPDLLAAIHSEKSISRNRALLLFSLVVISSIAWLFFGSQTQFLSRLRLEKPKAVMIELGRNISNTLAGTDSQGASFSYHSAYWSIRDNYIRHLGSSDLGPSRWHALGDPAQPAGLTLFYRESPRPLYPSSGIWPTAYNPPLLLEGMRIVEMDPRGRLLGWWYLSKNPQNQGADWQQVFQLAGLELSLFEPSQPRWEPLVWMDKRLAWSGTMPGSNAPIRIEAAERQGVPVFFSIVEPWDEDNGSRRLKRLTIQQTRIQSWSFYITILFVAIVAPIMVVRNHKKGRLDLRGANRLVLFLLTTSTIGWFLGAYHGMGPGETDHFVTYFGFLLFRMLLIGGAYLALEPYLRMYLARGMITWSRMTTGKIKDPRIAEDLLFAAACAGTFSALRGLYCYLAPELGIEYKLVIDPWLGNLGDLGEYINQSFTFGIYLATLISITMTLVYLFFLVIFRGKKALAFWVFAIVSLGFYPMDIVPRIFFATLVAYLIAKRGLFATVAFYFTFFLLAKMPMTFNPELWYASRSWFQIGVVIALAGYALHRLLKTQAGEHAAHVNSAPATS